MIKPWYKMTAAEILKIKKEKCQYCRFATRFNTDSSNLSIMMCDFIGITGHSRGCRPDECDKFEKSPDVKRRKGRGIRVNKKRGGSDDKRKTKTVSGIEERNKNVGGIN